MTLMELHHFRHHHIVNKDYMLISSCVRVNIYATGELALAWCKSLELFTVLLYRITGWTSCHSLLCSVFPASLVLCCCLFVFYNFSMSCKPWSSLIHMFAIGCCLFGQTDWWCTLALLVLLQCVEFVLRFVWRLMLWVSVRGLILRQQLIPATIVLVKNLSLASVILQAGWCKFTLHWMSPTHVPIHNSYICIQHTPVNGLLMSVYSKMYVLIIRFNRICEFGMVPPPPPPFCYIVSLWN